MGLSLRNLTHKIGDVLGGVERQVNPFDNGATYNRPQGHAPAPSFINQASHAPVVRNVLGVDRRIIGAGRWLGQNTLNMGMPIGVEAYNRGIAPIFDLPQQTLKPPKITKPFIGKEPILSPTQTYRTTLKSGHGKPLAIGLAALTAAAAYPGGSVARSSAKVGTASLLKKGMVDKDAVILNELRNVEKATGTKGDVNKFMYNSNMTRGSNSIANNVLQTSPNIQAAIGGLSKKDYRAFSDYANARTELASNRPKLSQTKSNLEATVAKGHPRFGARFDALNAHYKDLAQVARGAGLINSPTFKRYVANNDYVRLQRDMGDLLPDAFGQGKSYSLGKTILKQKRTGSERATLPAGETAANYTQQVYREAARNKTGTHLMDTLSQHGLAERLPSAAAARHENVVRIIRNGKVEHYKVSPQIKEAVNNINPYHMNAVMQILSIPGRTLRAGVTGLNPVFIARNLIKDQAGSAINSEHLAATHNPVNIFSGLWNASKGAAGHNNDPIWQNFIEHYGDQTSYDLTRNVKNTKQVVNAIRGGTAVKLGQHLKNPLRSLENIAQITEKSTRFQNFRGAYKKAIKDGLPPEQASQKAAIQAWQNSVDFSRAGEWGRVINTVIPYWNPATQGVRQMGRTFVKHPIKSSFTGAAILGVPLAAATAWNLKNDDTKKIYDNISENEKDNNLVLIPPGTKQNQDGTYDVIKVPLPPGYKDVFMPIRRALEAHHKDRPLEGRKIAQDILQATAGPIQTQTANQFFGSVTPQAVKPFVQQSANKDLFTGKQIVPDYMNAATDANGNPVPESKKAFQDSSGTATLVGQKINRSPIKLEKFTKDVGGTVGLNLLNASDRLLAKKGVVSKDSIGGQSISEGFKKSFRTTQGIVNPNKTAGAKYYENQKSVFKQVGANTNDINAWNALHPAKKNFLGDQITETDKTYDPAARLDAYNRYPKTLQIDRALDAKSDIHNPLYKLQDWQLKKVLEKQNLPPGAKDPELSNLYKQDWYQGYKSDTTKFYTDLKAKIGNEISALDKSGNKAAADKLRSSQQKFTNPDNPYPDTPPALQKAMDYYGSLPKGTGARSSWIKANPGTWNEMQNQYAKVDNWQNIARGERGLDYTEGQAGKAAGYPTLSFDSGGSGSSSRFYAKSKNPYYTPAPYAHAVARTAGGKGATLRGPSTKGPAIAKARKAQAVGLTKPKVSLKKSKV